MKTNSLTQRNSRVIAAAIVAASIVITGGMVAFAAAGASSSSGPAPENAVLEQNETMPNFYEGQVFQSEYEQGFFVGGSSVLTPHFPSGQGETLLGVAPKLFPTNVAYDIQVFDILVPAWGCAGHGGGIACGLVNALAPAYSPSFASHEVCPPATIQVCWDHPATVGVPNALLGGGAGFTVFPLPGHDHLIADLMDFADVWWHIFVVLVFNQAAWPSMSASHGITSVTNLTAHPVHDDGFVTESLKQAVLDGDALAPITTNAFLNFANLQHGDD